ncbi:hypothetical protein V1478_010173 [Vespula squamosa]|uniref:Uncharacterized protein n=1 Tax=Vespula squamosa TaxID=30214 RepID=A0ABD2AIZ3_VESSQ
MPNYYNYEYRKEIVKQLRLKNSWQSLYKKKIFRRTHFLKFQFCNMHISKRSAVAYGNLLRETYCPNSPSIIAPMPRRATATRMYVEMRVCSQEAPTTFSIAHRNTYYTLTADIPVTGIPVSMSLHFSSGIIPIKSVLGQASYLTQDYFLFT